MPKSRKKKKSPKRFQLGGAVGKDWDAFQIAGKNSNGHR